MIKSLFFVLTLMSATALPVLAEEAEEAEQAKCGPIPALHTDPDTEEKIKGQLQGQANFLSKLVGNAQLGGEIETARKTIYQSSEKFLAAQKDAYLAYLFCILVQDKNLNGAERLKALNEFKRPVSATQPGIVRQIGNNFLDKENMKWSFKAPAGAIIEAIGLNCRASISAGQFSYSIDKDGKVPVPGLDGEEVLVSISLVAGSRSPLSVGMTADPKSCHGKFVVTAAD